MANFTHIALKGFAVAVLVVVASVATIYAPGQHNESDVYSSANRGGLADLEIGVDQVNFGQVKPGEAASAIVVLTHTGTPDSGPIVIDNLFLDELDSLHYTLNTSGPLTLAPSASFDLLVGFEPTESGSFPGRLIVNHNGKSGVDVIDLNGQGFDENAPVFSAANPPSLPFGKSKLSGFFGGKPTSLQFGPDGRLYVAYMDGSIHVFDIEREGDNDYVVTDSDVITLIKNIPNHNDKGDKAPWLKKRLVTGILVTGTAENPVVYVQSSDPRIGGGHSGNTTGLDTNSGVLSRLTKTAAGWEKLDLVRGLPRSEENHHGNGMALVGSTLYLAAGGNTNMGATSNNFAMLPEYALSAAILSIDLEQIGETTYDLPTLNDEQRPAGNGASPKDTNDPFGGNGGKNQAMLVDGGPVQVYASGLRNPYDVVVMQNGKMYSWDNGPNSGWGGVPAGCSNARKEPGNTQHDALHLISGPGYYGGHPNPTRGSQKNKFNASNPQSPVPYSNPVECDYYGPGTNGNGKHPLNKSLISLPRSTNGITEYTAANLSGAMTGNLLAVSWDNKVYRVAFKPTGELDYMKVLFSNVGVSPLDVTAQSDDSVFPGTIWVVDLQSQSVVIYEPGDYEGGGQVDAGGCVLSTGAGDSDNDGFTNADEIANGTDGCSAADVPADVDGDRISDLIDMDDDNDNIPDVDDPFAVDPANGANTDLPVDYQWENDSPDPGFIASLGFTGLMTNGEDSYQTQYDLNEMTIIGAAGVVTVDSVPAGDPLNKKNSQKFGFQFGIDVGPSSDVFRAQTRIPGPFSGFVPKLHQSMGLYIGTGDQDNYVKLIIKHNSAQLLTEVDGKVSYAKSYAEVFTETDFVDLILEVDPASAIATAYFQITKNDLTEQEVQVASVDFPATWLTGPTRLAVGIISTSIGAQPFPATWDFMTVKPLDEGSIVNVAPTVIISDVGEVTAGIATLVTAAVDDDGLPSSDVSLQWKQLSGPAVVMFDDDTQSSSLMTFSEAGSYELQLTAFDGELTSTDTTTFVVNSVDTSTGNIVYRINAGGPLLPAADGDWQSDAASAQYFNTGKTWKSTAAVDVSGISTGTPAKLFNTERYDTGAAPELEWKLPVTPGQYVVRLYFSENFIGTMKTGGRVFDVDVEGQSAAGIDVFASVGANKAMVKSFTVQADDTLNILFTRTTQNPAIKGIEVLTADATDDPVTPPGNQPPAVSAGADKETTVAVPVTLAGSVTDDGLPAYSVTNNWSMVSGPASAQFTLTGSAVTQVTFPEAGMYLLRLTADDGELTGTDEVQVNVTAADPVVNKAPLVVAGPDVSSTAGEMVALSGNVSDDGLPSNTLTTLWSLQSGPAQVTFTSPDAVATTAGLPVAGEYVLRLSATDTVLGSFDELTIKVEEEPVVSSVVYRINAGGPMLADSSGNWAADKGASSLANTGNSYTKGVAIDTSSAPGVPFQLFQSERWDKKSGAKMTWKLPVAPGSYGVYLYFSEIYGGAMGNGKRVFSVDVEGQTLPALDVYAEAGANTALVKYFPVENTDGFLDIVFDHGIQNPSIKGIEVMTRN